MSSCSRDCDWPAGRDDNITNGSRHQPARRIRLSKRSPRPPIGIGAPTHAEGNAVMTTLPATGELDIVRTVRAAGYALDTEPV